MDEVDRAGEAEQWARDLAIAAARQQTEPRTPSRTHCIDCYFAIEPERRKMNGVTRCAECEGYYQQEQRQKGLKV